MKIREFYLENYPTDDLGLEIDSTATFGGLYEALERYDDVYEYIGVSDSIIRERLFERLSIILECTYDEIYSQWLWTPQPPIL